jgi:hypothetical protein
MYFFEQCETMVRPINDPRLFITYSNDISTAKIEALHADRLHLKPFEGHMFRINKLAKALMDFSRSLSLFIHVAKEGRGRPDIPFWIISPLLDQNVALYLMEFMLQGFNITCIPIDETGSWPPHFHKQINDKPTSKDEKIKSKWSFIADLAGPNIKIPPFIASNEWLLEIYVFMFGPNADLIYDLMRYHELVDPEEVSYSACCQDLTSVRIQKTLENVKIPLFKADPFEGLR